ncbi:MAG: uroporphyrinogen-III synthase [Prolixibacteraceae bacterium]|nr:uroporphyrinogen-III synthase [Prolixibacteraceae bacterium]
MASSNRHIISTRPKRQNNELKQLLEKQGYTLLELPMIEIHRAKLSQSDFEKLENIQQYSWIVFTSPNGIRHFFHHYKNTNGTNSLPANVKTAVVGTTTQKILEEFGNKTTLVNPGNTGKELAEFMLDKITETDRILFPEGNLARGVISGMLSKKASCESIVVYENRMPKDVDEKILQKIIDNQYEFIVLTSPSGFINLKKTLTGKTDLAKLRLVSIGTSTSAEVEAHGFKPNATANMSNAQGIAKAISEMRTDR